MIKGAILIFVFGHMSYAWLLVAVIINAMSIMIPPNYWATPGVAFPLSLMGAGAFGMGLISNTASAIGPLVFSFLVPNLGWDGVFVVIAILAVVGIVINIQASRIRLDSTQNSYVQNTTQL